LNSKHNRKTRALSEKPKEPDVFTIGHSTRSEAEFSSLLETYGITCLVDIRIIPKSRRNPQFNQEALIQDLRSEGIKYIHIKELGGLRRPTKDLINSGWRNSSFRGYADYMQTTEFKTSLGELIQLISKERSAGGKVAYMCAEAVPWRCHRSLLSDALSVRGLRVAHILSKSAISFHKITPFARVQGVEITYPKQECSQRKPDANME
jgi:uncharacterized protein (DUF488 family)